MVDHGWYWIKPSHMVGHIPLRRRIVAPLCVQNSRGRRNADPALWGEICGVHKNDKKNVSFDMVK